MANYSFYAQNAVKKHAIFFVFVPVQELFVPDVPGFFVRRRDGIMLNQCGDECSWNVEDKYLFVPDVPELKMMNVSDFPEEKIRNRREMDY